MNIIRTSCRSHKGMSEKENIVRVQNGYFQKREEHSSRETTHEENPKDGWGMT